MNVIITNGLNLDDINLIGGYAEHQRLAKSSTLKNNHSHINGGTKLYIPAVILVAFELDRHWNQAMD